MGDEAYFTLVFQGDLRKYPTNPHMTDTPFGRPVASGIGNVFDEVEALHSALSGGEATGDQRGSNGTRAAKVSPQFRADPSFTFLLTEQLVATEKDNLRLRDESAELTKALTGLTCGGSEFFIRKGDRYVADIDACVSWVRRAKGDAHRRSLEAIKARQAAEDENGKLKAALAEAAAYLNALGDNLLRNDADMLLDECEDPKDVAARLTRQEGSEEGDRLGRLKVGAGDPKTLSKEGQR